jgi:hypothetical protein
LISSTGIWALRAEGIDAAGVLQAQFTIDIYLGLHAVTAAGLDGLLVVAQRVAHREGLGLFQCLLGQQARRRISLFAIIQQADPHQRGGQWQVGGCGQRHLAVEVLRLIRLAGTACQQGQQEGSATQVQAHQSTASSLG